MMFSRVAAFAIAALPLLAAATPIEDLVKGKPKPPAPKCNTGPMQCCNSVQSSKSQEAQNQAGLLGIDLGSVIGDVGLKCSPINVIGVESGNACQANTVCCKNNSYGSLISTGCVPVIL